MKKYQLKSIYKYTRISIVILFAIIISSWKTKQHTNSISTIDKVVYEEMIRQNLPGVAVGVIRNGQIVYTNGYGYSNLRNKTKVTTRTPFRWASISKTLTAVAALQMDEQRSDFSINDKVNKHVNSWHQKSSDIRSKITIKHLLTNRSGINHYGHGKQGKQTKFTSKIKSSDTYKSVLNGFNAFGAVNIFKDAPLDFNPGSDHLYTSYGFNLLGAAIEKSSPRGYIDWVNNNIARPAGMTSLKSSTQSRMGYARECDGRLNTVSIGSVEWKLPGGGWESNIIDLAKFTQALMNGDLLKNTSRLWTNIPNNSSYSYGIERKIIDGQLYVHHGGVHSNLRTLMHFCPRTKNGIVVMCWSDHADVGRIVSHIYREYFKIGSFNPSSMPLNGSEKDCSGRFSGVWRKTGDNVIVRRGYFTNDFTTELKFLQNQGYECTDLEGYTQSGKLLWDGVFKKGAPKIEMYRNKTKSEFENRLNEMKKRGFVPVDIETYYNPKGEQKWAGIFKRSATKSVTIMGYSQSDFGSKRTALNKQGYKLVDIELITKNNTRFWSGVFVAGSPNKLGRNYSTSDFDQLVDKYEQKGYHLLDVEVFMKNGKRLWTGIFEKVDSKGLSERVHTYNELMGIHFKESQKGYELIDLERHN